MKGECKICGVKIEWRFGAKRYCDGCRRARKLVYNRFVAYARKHPEREHATGEEFERLVIEQTRRELLERGKARARAWGNPRPCPYCGRPTRDVYCYECRREGFDGVHKVTGKTNGWDSPRRKRALPRDAQTVDGWRGRKVGGGGKQKLWAAWNDGI